MFINIFMIALNLSENLTPRDFSDNITQFKAGKLTSVKQNIFFIISTSIYLMWSFAAGAAVIPKNKLWSSESSLVVVFIDGSESQKELVKRYAPLWLETSKLSFSFFDGFINAPKETHIRINFQSHTGSLIGNHGNFLSKDPTLLLDQLNQTDLPESVLKRFILHEFGHALGFEHEYRNPKWPYGLPAIEEHINGCIPRLKDIGFAPLLAQQRCIDINKPLKKVEVNATIYDEFSIMNYPQRILLNDGSYKQITSLSDLSVLDILAIERWYGKK
jgi:hypothetical protein